MDHHIYLVDIPKLYISIIRFMDLHNSILYLRNPIYGDP